MRISSLAVLALALGACEPKPQGPPGNVGEAEQIECAIGGAGEFSPSCVVERASAAGENYLVVRHPDGAFRRFEVLKDGFGLASADGADRAQTSFKAGILEVIVGRDRYRFPAVRAPNAARR